jgi:hypothetical protein
MSGWIQNDDIIVSSTHVEVAEVERLVGRALVPLRDGACVDLRGVRVCVDA